MREMDANGSDGRVDCPATECARRGSSSSRDAERRWPEQDRLWSSAGSKIALQDVSSTRLVGRNPSLQLAHFTEKRRLVTDGRRPLRRAAPILGSRLRNRRCVDEELARPALPGRGKYQPPVERRQAGRRSAPPELGIWFHIRARARDLIESVSR